MGGSGWLLCCYVDTDTTFFFIPYTEKGEREIPGCRQALFLRADGGIVSSSKNKSNHGLATTGISILAFL